MKESWNKGIEFVLKWEGGLTSDTGGLTKYGISQNAYPDADIAGLTLDGAKHIYKRDYWDYMGCDSYKYPTDIIVFDTAVNCGKQRTDEWINISQYWQDILLERILHYTTLAQKPKYQPYFRGWMNRVMDLYKTVNDNV